MLQNVISVNWFFKTSAEMKPLTRVASVTIKLRYYAAAIDVSLFFPPVALQSLKDLGRLTYRRFLELFRHMVGLLGRVIIPSQGLSTYTGQHNSERRWQTFTPWAGFGPTISAINRPRPTPHTARPLWPADASLYLPLIRSFFLSVSSFNKI
jgi:hypothetical protein